MANQDSRVQAVIAEEKQPSGVGREMPRYKSHKVIHALKIAELLSPAGENEETDGSLIMVPVDEGFAPLRLAREYVQKHKPQTGGYFVVYNDGYQSWSPEKAFEEGYTRV